MPSPFSLAQKRIWITGGAGHLGAPITRELDAQGAAVLCIDLPGRAEALVREHRLAHTVPVALDVNEATTLPAALEAAVAEHGLPDGLVHLAFASSSGHRLETLPAEEFQRTFDHALTPTFVLCRTLAEKMKPRGSGSFVLFASMYGIVAPDPRIYPAPMVPNPIDYGPSKAALLQLSRYFASHYGPSGLRFNCVTPGPFPNPGVQQANPAFVNELAQKTVLRRIGRNDEIVGPVVFLLSDSASYVTGQSLVVDGGWTVM